MSARTWNRSDHALVGSPSGHRHAISSREGVSGSPLTEKPTRVPGRCGRREIRSGHRGTIDGASIGANIVADDAMFPSLPRRARNWGVALLAGAGLSDRPTSEKGTLAGVEGTMEPAGRPEDLFELLEQLGKGSYGAVYKARHRPSGTIVAVKVIPLSGEDEEGLEDIRREIAVLQECVHPNVVRYFGSFMGNEYLWIVMEHCGGGSVRDILSASNRPLRGSADRVPLRRDAQRPRLPPLHLQGAQGHQVQQHLTHGERRGQARRLRRRRAAHADHEQAQHLHRHPALDGPGGDPRIPLRRKSGRVGAGHLRDRDGGNPTAQARRPPHARHLHDHQGAIPAAGESRGEA